MFKRKTLSGILSGFNKTLSELNAFTDEAGKRRGVIREETQRLKAEDDALLRDMLHADAVKDNLQKLVGTQAAQ